MAPTSILAEQHYHTITAFLDGMGISCALLVGSLTELEKEAVHQRVASGECQVVIGTHALVQSSVRFSRLGLVVVDEQHRFGVEQRGALRAKGATVQPHLLAMSATPIPRTLAMTIYGDLDISVLDELPPNRQQVTTAVRDETSRERIYAFISSQIKLGHQAFIICPLVEESEDGAASPGAAKAAVTEHQRLQREVFPQHRLGLLHGRLKAEEKEQVMAAFKEGAYDILVSTAVVEVGIDIPNATVILIEGAERFGLAQLHQFRGRVGRGEARSYCILLSDDTSEGSIKRLQFMEQSNDGFFLAEKDLETRGPGDWFGVRQSGLPNLKVARLSDTAILEKARAAALALFREDPDLEQPEHAPLAAEVQRFWSTRELVDVEVAP
jgi:ATP-dependent DNA helicase RecG